jgi:hypothetical protein
VVVSGGVSTGPDRIVTDDGAGRNRREGGCHGGSAMRTGNYTVLRDVASPSFREANSAGRLSQIFAPVAAKNLDLAAVAILGPQLLQAPSIDQNKRLHITGYFPGNPVQLNFDLMFEPVNGQWRLFGLSVVPAPATSTNASAAPANPPPSPAPADQKSKSKK